MAEAPLSSLLSAVMFRRRPRENVMIRLSAVPASSHGAELARVISVPAAVESRLPDDVSALPKITATRNRAGGLTATVRRLTAWGTRFVRGIALVCHEGLPFLFPLADPPAAKQYCNRMFREIRATSEFLNESITM